MKENKVLVVGANGQLGQCFRELRGDKYLFASREELDITDLDRLCGYVGANDVNIIINCAAYTEVDRAEGFYHEAWKINEVGAGNLAKVMEICNGVLIHISTDYVFGNTNHGRPFVEDDKTDPMCVYGETKCRGEEVVRRILDEHLIIRTSWLYSEFGNNFFNTMMRLTRQHSEINVVNDQVGCPTYAMDLAEWICGIVDNRLFVGNYGTYHYSNEGICSWFDFATEINRALGHKCRISSCLSDEFPSKVRRPHYSVLSVKKAKNAFKMDIPYWRDSLEKCVDKIKI